MVERIGSYLGTSFPLFHVQDTLSSAECAAGFYSGLGGTKSSFKSQFAAPIFQYPVMITIIIPAPLAAEGCGWGGVVWILAVSLHLSLCFQPPPTHQHQWQQTMCLLYLYLVRTSQNKMFCEPFCGTLVPYLYILLSGFYDQNVSILLRGPHHWTHPHLCAADICSYTL